MGQNKDKTRPELIPFGDRNVQGNRRIAIPNILLQIVDLQEGDTVALFLDVGELSGEKAIVIKKSANTSNNKTRGRGRGDVDGI